MRLAYRLARGTPYRSGHELLNDVEPEEWAYMQASYKLDPYGDDWERSSMIAAELSNVIGAFATGFAGEGATAPRQIPFDAFVPYRKHVDPDEQELEASLESLEDMRGI